MCQQLGWTVSACLGVFAEESLTTKDGHDCFKVNYEYIFKADGIALAVQVMLASPSCPPAHLATLPRVGLRFALPSGFSKMTWLGGDMCVCSQKNVVGWCGSCRVVGWEWPGWMDLIRCFGEAVAQGKHIQIARRQVTGPFIAVRLGCSFWFVIFVVIQELKMDQSPTFRSGQTATQTNEL